MKKLRTIIAAVTAAAMCMPLASCGGKKEVYKVGICQLAQHEALDAATQGFQDALKEKLIKK